MKDVEVIAGSTVSRRSAGVDRCVNSRRACSTQALWPQRATLLKYLELGKLERA